MATAHGDDSRNDVSRESVALLPLYQSIRAESRRLAGSVANVVTLTSRPGDYPLRVGWPRRNFFVDGGRRASPRKRNCLSFPAIDKINGFPSSVAEVVIDFALQKADRFAELVHPIYAIFYGNPRVKSDGIESREDPIVVVHPFANNAM